MIKGKGIKKTFLTLFLSGLLWANISPAYHITADQAAFFRDTHTSVFTGHVLCTQNGTVITGTQLTLHLDMTNKQILYWVLIGDAATYKTRLKNKKEPLVAQAGIIQYYTLDKVAVFEKNAVITVGQNRITGPYIVYDLKKQMVKSRAHTKTDEPAVQTTIIIQPEQ